MFLVPPFQSSFEVEHQALLSLLGSKSHDLTRPYGGVGEAMGVGDAVGVGSRRTLAR